MKKNYVFSLAAIAAVAWAGAYTVAAEGDAPAGQQAVLVPSSVVPADGATVKSISTVELQFSMGETVVMDNQEMVSKIMLSNGEGEMPAAGMDANYEGYTATWEQVTIYTVKFDGPIEEPGQYTVTIPAGVFVEKEYSEAAEDFVPTGKVNKELVLTLTVDPNASTGASLNNYSVSPENNSTVLECGAISVTFGDFTAYDYSVQVSDNEEAKCYVNGSRGEEYTVDFAADMSGENPERVFIAELENMLAAGAYSVYIPEGTFVKGDEKSPEIAFSFTVAAPRGTIEVAKVTPAADKAVGYLDVVTVFLPTDGENMVQPKESLLGEVRVYNSDNEQVSVGASQGEVEFDDASGLIGWPIVLSKPVTAAGTYTVEIAEGIFEEVAYDASAVAYFATGKVNKAYNASVTVDPSLAPSLEKYTTSPANNAAVAAPEAITVTFEDFGAYDYSLQVSDNAEAKCYVTNGAGAEYELDLINDMSGETEGRAFVAELPSALTTGAWSVYIPAGTFTNGVLESPEISFSFVVSTMEDYVITPAEGSTVESLTAVTISFPSLFGTASVAESEEAIVMLTNSANMQEFVLKPVAGNEEGTVAFTAEIVLEKDQTLANGMYTVYIPAGTFVGEFGVSSPEIYTYFTLNDGTAGIDGVVSGEQTVDVYSIDGRVVAKGADAGAVKNLPAGLYIINGKKYIVK